jgi:hypothetical protein
MKVKKTETTEKITRLFSRIVHYNGYVEIDKIG